MIRRFIVAAMSFVLSVPLAASAHEPKANASVDQAPPPSALTAAPDGYVCPAYLHTLSPQEVWEFRYAAIAAGDLDLTMCTYARDAVVITPGNVAHGRDEIRQALSMMFQFFPEPPVLTSVTIDGPVVMVTFHIEGPFLSIPDGSDTYVIHHGLIHYQTVHDTLVPTAQ
jgi:hypothetical protein